MTTQSLLLDQDSWDLLVDANGNVAVADEPYRIAQDVATECRLFQSDYWYNITLGLPYFSKILGERPPLQLLKSYYISAAKGVVGVVKAACFFNAITSKRELTGQVQSTDQTGNILTTAI